MCTCRYIYSTTGGCWISIFFQQQNLTNYTCFVFVQVGINIIEPLLRAAEAAEAAEELIEC